MMENSTDSQIQTYLDGLMTPAEVRAFEAELARNPTLAAELAAWEALFADLDNLPEAAFTLEQDFSTAVVAQIDAEVALAPQTRWLSVVQLLVAAIALVASWPLLSRLFTALQLWLPELDSQAGLLDSWLRDQQLRWMALTELFSQQVTTTWLERPLPDLNLPLTPLLIGGGVAALLWIITNAYLWRTWSDNRFDQLAR